MKWKCDIGCAYGPCICEGEYKPCKCCVCDDFPIDWKKVDDEPERKEETGLPEWLKIGNFVWMDAGFMSIKKPEYQGVSRGIYKIISIKSDSLRIESIHDRGNGYFKIPWGDADEIQRLSMRPVYPKPYTFETAPVAIKARRKGDSFNALLYLTCRGYAFRGFTAIVPGCNDYFVSFSEALHNYEQVDGWPCGTFDEEGDNKK